MNVRQEYGGDSVDELITFFMKTVLRCRKYGRCVIRTDACLDVPAASYLKLAASFIEDSQPPEVTELLLETEYQAILTRERPERKQILLLTLIKALTYHFAFDSDPTEYICAIGNLWQEKANEYATRTFFGNLPREIQKREGMEKVLECVPPDFLRLEDY